MEVPNKIRKMLNNLSIAEFNAGMISGFKHPESEWKRICWQSIGVYLRPFAV
jgi:hypothetical protein